jgi:hypothetical protein
LSHSAILFCRVFSRWGSHDLFVQAGLEPYILLIFASQTARIIGMSHLYSAYLFKLSITLRILVLAPWHKPAIPATQGRVWEDGGFRPAYAKSYKKDHISTKQTKHGGTHLWSPLCSRLAIGGIVDWGWPWQKQETLPEK